MAFKILSQDEIQKLTSAERKNYEQLYAEYQEREAFVNRLERQRKVKVPRFKIKKRASAQREVESAIIATW